MMGAEHVAEEKGRLREGERGDRKQRESERGRGKEPEAAGGWGIGRERESTYACT